MWKLIVAVIVFAGGVLSYAAISRDVGEVSDTSAQVGDLPVGEDATAKPDEGWAATNCPNALPPQRIEESPYNTLIRKYSENGDHRQYEWAVAKAVHFNACVTMSYGLARNALVGNRAHQAMLDGGGTQASIEITSKAFAKAEHMGGYGRFGQIIVDKSFDLAYADPGNRPVASDINAIVRKTFCECFLHPTELFLEEEGK